jgi:hypothetical protein
VGRKFRNKLDLHRFFGDKYDMSLLDYKSGKVSQIAWRKQRRLKSMATNIASACKYDNYLNLKIRFINNFEQNRSNSLDLNMNLI